MGQMLGHASLEGGSVFNYHAAAENHIAQISTPGFVPGRPRADFAAPVTGGAGGGGGNPAPTAFTGKLVAPEGSSVVTPLTDLVATLQATGLSLQAAKAKVNDALGLTAGFDIQALDPIYVTLSSDPVERTAGKQALAAAVSLQNTIVQAAAVFQEAGASPADIQAAQDVVAARRSRPRSTPSRLAARSISRTPPSWPPSLTGPQSPPVSPIRMSALRHRA